MKNAPPAVLNRYPNQLKVWRRWRSGLLPYVRISGHGSSTRLAEILLRPRQQRIVGRNTKRGNWRPIASDSRRMRRGPQARVASALLRSRRNHAGFPASLISRI